MHQRYWVLDTTVLHHSSEMGLPAGDHAKAQAAFDVLQAVSRAHRIAVDARHRCETEYANAWKEIRKHTQRYPAWSVAHSLWSDVWQRGPHRGEKPVPAALLKVLEAANIKDESDLAFVEAANATDDKLLATEDTDYSEEIRAALKATPGVNVNALHYPDAAKIALPRMVAKATGAA